jgi:hypothetical protein
MRFKMISFSLNIVNPWSNKRWVNTWHRAYDTPHKHKFIELEAFKDNNIASFSFSVTTRTDHAGLMIELGLLGRSFSFNLYDNRHWNSDKGRYCIYNEELGEH